MLGHMLLHNLAVPGYFCGANLAVDDVFRGVLHGDSAVLAVVVLHRELVVVPDVVHQSLVLSEVAVLADDADVRFARQPRLEVVVALL